MKNTAITFLLILCFCTSVVSQPGDPPGNPDLNNSISFDDMIGQMIMVGIQGYSLKDDPQLQKDLEDGYVGGVILYEKNIASKNSWVQMKRMTQQIQNSSPVPSFIAIDQEGGKVNRLKTKYGFPPSRSAEYLGELNNEDSTRFYSQLTASVLAGLGINVNFAPDVDVNVNPTNPIIAGVDRSYSANPYTVAQQASFVIDEHRKMNILSVLKHFPGHGSSKGDTHLGMVDVTNSWIEEELTPFQVLISRNQADAIMTAHIINENLDPEKLPGTLSEKIIRELLRDSLQFNNLVFSDDMQMKAIAEHFGLEQAIADAINAGVDILLFSNNISGVNERTASKVHGIIKNLVETGKVPESRIRESFVRIIDAKKKIGLVN